MSRGKLTSLASDYGGLEVFASAAIGHTDPYKVIEEVDAELGTRSADVSQLL